MSFLDDILAFFDLAQPAPQPKVWRAPQPHSRPAAPPSEQALLAASKAVHSLALIDQAYSLNIWNDPVHRKNWEWDLAVKLQNRNLKSVRIELVDSSDTVICEATIHFKSRSGSVTNGAKGIEVPLVDHRYVARHRVLVTTVNPDESPYRHLMKLNWSSVETLRRAPGSNWSTTHSRKTGGRQQGKLHVSSQARQTLVITRPIGSKGYGFADCPAQGKSGIYLHLRHVDPMAARLGAGGRISALLVQTLDGIQARDVKLA